MGFQHRYISIIGLCRLSRNIILDMDNKNSKNKKYNNNNLTNNNLSNNNLSNNNLNAYRVQYNPSLRTQRYPVLS